MAAILSCIGTGVVVCLESMARACTQKCRKKPASPKPQSW